MPYTPQFVSFTNELNEGIQAIVDAFNLFFSGNQVQLDAVDFSRPQSTYRSNELRLRVAYSESTEGLEIEARLFRSQPAGDSAAAQFNALYEGGACLVPLQIIDVSDHETSKSTAVDLIAIFANTDRAGPIAGMFGDKRSTFVAEAQALIAAGGSGLADIYDFVGRLIQAGATVTNVSAANDIQSGERVPAVLDMDGGTYIALPTCEGIAPLVTETPPTTTPPAQPCPTVESVTNPPTVPPLS